MKKNKTIILSLATSCMAACAVMTSCSDDRFDNISGEGTLELSATLSSDVTVISRSDTDLKEAYGESLFLWLSKEGVKGPVRQYQGLSNIPTQPITLTSGSYVAEAWAGDSVPASFEARYFKAVEPFDIKGGVSTRLDVKLRIANVLVSVNYSSEVDEVLKDYTMTASHSAGSLTFTGRDDSKGYFMMPNNRESLTLTLNATDMSGKPYTQTAVIERPQPTTEYQINVKTSTEEVSTPIIDIEIDVIEIPDDTPTDPQIAGVDFDIAMPQSAAVGNTSDLSVDIEASTAIESLVMSSATLESIIGFEDIDFVRSQSSWLESLREGGVRHSISTGEVAVRVTIESGLLNTLSEGSYKFLFTATDDQGRMSSATLCLEITNAPIFLNPVADEDLGYQSVRLTAAIVSTEQIAQSRGADGFRYRISGSDAEWSFVEATISGSTMSAHVEGLTDATTYDYAAVYSGFISPSRSFTTLALPQLPNASFEYWTTSSAPYLVYGTGQEMYWDTGNHGAATLGGNVTVPDTDYRSSGRYSAKLKSQFIGIGSIGKFAAGNIFVGQYLGTDGTDGILGWGRPFDSPVKPKALTGMVRYVQGTVDYESSDLSWPKKGNKDQGIVRVALLSDNANQSYNGSSWPVIIKTKTKELFNENGSNVVAYGEVVFNSSTQVAGMESFTVELHDVNPSLHVKYITVVGSASRYGDYFVGSTGSCMWLDDIKLVY